MPKVSVIVPVYNSEKCLSRCIDSILTQAFIDFELLLIDDGSIDKSGMICDEYAYNDERIKVFHKINGGASSARNLGLDKAKGQWIAFVDSDDYVYPTFLSTYMLLCKDDADLYICGIISDITSEEKITNASFDYIGNTQGALFLLNRCQMPGSLCNKLFKRSIIEKYKIRLNESFKFKEDEEFLFRYMLNTQKIIATVKEEYVYSVSNWNKYDGIENLPTNISMYDSVLKIFNGKANLVTDSYLILLLNEILSNIKLNGFKVVKLLPQIIRTIRWSIFRVTPLKAVCKKVYKYVKCLICI